VSKKFKDTYVLGEGYPWVMGLGPNYRELALCSKPAGGPDMYIKFPIELWDVKVPKYKLVLKRVK
jgi:hypothetical protein